MGLNKRFYDTIIMTLQFKIALIEACEIAA